MNEETPLWKGSPSQWLNLGPFSLCLLLAIGIVIAAILSGPLLPLVLLALAIPLVWLIWRYLVVRSQLFELTSERLRVTTGIINQHIDEVELYRVKDSLMKR
ncbi:MAG: hypothetical protein EOP85_06405, partial [Verrucomicrobiaceae bacterium]